MTLQKIKNGIKSIPPMRLILLGYLFIIFLGTVLLSLPIASSIGKFTDFSDAFFTATSATCVTGLIRFDTYTHWSFFGQFVILALIQIGGLGFMTWVISVITLTKKKIGFNTRFLMQNSISAPQVGGIIGLAKKIFKYTVIVEGIGALMLGLYFVPRLGVIRGIWFSIFHSISAFCNAGFDLMGYYKPFSSLTTVADNAYVNIIIIALIVVGGLGFIVWMDLLKNKFNFKKLGLHSRVVLIFSLSLIIIGTVGLFVFELGGDCYKDSSLGNKFLKSLFQSVSTRTAGMNSVDLSTMTDSSKFLMIILMLIGGSPGSTAGGMKTTTFAVLIMSVQAIFKRKQSIEIMRRRLDQSALQSAACIFITYLLLMTGSGMIISAIEGIPILSALFETGSAIGTVGMSLGVTTSLGLISKLIISGLMIFGRLGSITLLLAFSIDDRHANFKYPLGKLQIG